MKNKVIPNPILPTAGVRRNIAADGGAGPPSGGQHDDRTPNQQGGVLSDHSTPSNALMRYRSPFVMGTFNACTVREEARLVELAHCAEERGVEILGIQEHRRVHTDDRIVYRRVERCTFITVSAWRNQAQAATGGVGLMLGPLARKALRLVYHHTDRILIAEFSGNPVTTVIVVYSPTSVAPSEEVEKFYEDLATAVRDVPAHNFLAILGDFNARLGPEDAPYPYHDSTNRNGAYLMALLMEHELLAANTIFRKRTGKRWTQVDRATGMLRQLDYILVRQKWRNSILNAEPYSTFSSVGSDNSVVSMRVRLSLRVPRQSS
ncbi:craniofacial development protein 2-like, partial [Pseudochaenichthys georgianus]|uniref:craniofacial development protein 2-like n=1 Tax=Pseudochaenichthys georgianus TaxID=52239 RepID=UPI00146CDD5D